MSERATTDQKPKRPDRIKVMHDDLRHRVDVHYFGDESVLVASTPDIALGREQRRRLAELLLEGL